MKFACAFGLALAGLLLSSTASRAEPPPRGTLAAYDPATSARIRVFGGAGFSISIAPDGGCYRTKLRSFLNPLEKKAADAPEPLIPTKKNGLMFGTIMTGGKNESIGMPPSASSARTNHRSLLVGQLYFYMEYAVPAGQPIVLLNSYFVPDSSSQAGNMVFYQKGRSCPTVAVRLVPQAGKNYEVSNGYEDGRCSPHFIELPDDSGPTTEGAELTLPPVPACPS